MTTEPAQAELSQAFSELLDEVRAVERKMLDAQPPLDEADLLDGYRLAFSLLRVAVDAYVWNEKERPRLVDVIAPFLKWGGDTPTPTTNSHRSIPPGRTASAATAATPSTCR